MRVLIIPFFIVFSFNAFAQKASCATDCSCSVSGTVIDAVDLQPVAFATLKIANSIKGTTTNEFGEFLLTDLCVDEFDLIISHIGYKTLTHHHDSYHNEPIVKLAPDDLILESVVIEEKVNTSGINSINEKSLSGLDYDEVKNESLGDALSSITGVSTLKTGQNIVKPIVHGLHSNRILIVNDGVRLESQDWGREHAPEIDPSLTDEIRLIKGAATVKYGPNALGGVIVINGPKMELSSHLHGDVTVKGQSNGRALDGNFSLQKGYENFVWLVQGASRMQGDLKTPDYSLTNSGAKEYSGTIGFRYHRKNADVQLRYNFLDQKLGILRGSVVGNQEDLANALASDIPAFTNGFSYNISTPNQRIIHHIVKLENTYNWKNSQLKLLYGFQLNKRREFDVRRGSNNGVPSIDLELVSHTLNAEWIHPEVGGWSGSLGIQGIYQDNNNLPGTNTIPFVPNFNTSRIGVFIEEAKAFGKTTTEFGLRYDLQSSSFRGRASDNSVFIHDQNFQSFSGLIGFIQSLSPNTSLRSNIATAWRPPNIAELYSFGKHQFTNEYGFYRYNDINGDINTDVILSPEELEVKNELGYKWITSLETKVNNLRLEVSPFVNLIKNYIYAIPRGISNTVRGTFPYFIYIQNDAVFAGLDATAILTHHNNFESKLSGSYLYAKDISNNDLLFGIPANKLTYRLTYQSKKGANLDLRSWFEVSHVFKQNRAPRVIAAQAFVDNPALDPFEENDNNFDFIEAPDSYTLLSIGNSVTIKQIVIGLKVNNLLNTSYRDYTNLLRYFADEPGINIQASIQIKL